jgi:hypothetical protein
LTQNILLKTGYKPIFEGKTRAMADSESIIKNFLPWHLGIQRKYGKSQSALHSGLHLAHNTSLPQERILAEIRS